MNPFFSEEVLDTFVDNLNRCQGTELSSLYYKVMNEAKRLFEERTGLRQNKLKNPPDIDQVCVDNNDLTLQYETRWESDWIQVPLSMLTDPEQWIETTVAGWVKLDERRKAEEAERNASAEKRLREIELKEFNRLKRKLKREGVIE